MSWIPTNPQLICKRYSSLVIRNEENFALSDDCLSILEEILDNLATEDLTSRTFRRAIGFGQNIRKDLLPILINTKPDSKIKNATKIIDATIKILVSLTIPVEYLLSMDSFSSGSDVGEHAVFELKKLSVSAKEMFADSKTTKAIMDHIRYFLEKNTFTVEECNIINNCLVLLINILHISEGKGTVLGSTGHTSLQNQIIWNLFTQSFDKLIIYLITCPQKMFWSATLVQLIALLYKDQHAGTLQKLLNIWLETSMSDSSEDNESNTSPPDQGSGDSSPLVTSDPTSDSSDNNIGSIDAIEKSERKDSGVASLDFSSSGRGTWGKYGEIKRVQSTETETSGVSSNFVSSLSTDNELSPDPPSPKQINLLINSSPNTLNAQGLKRQCPPSSQSEISDCGYATQVENQESISTSSDEQLLEKPVHQKPHSFQKTRYIPSKTRAATIVEKNELRRKKLVKRSKTNIINMKGLVHHLPTDDDISNILKEFTVDFLLKCYGPLVQDLYHHFLTSQVQIDTSHFFWLVTYFLKFATQLELDLEHISHVLCYDIMSYLVFQGVCLSEELEIVAKIDGFDLKPCLRRLYLVVTAIREFMVALESYQKMNHLSESDQKYLLKLQTKTGETEDLRLLFLLLLKQYNPRIQNKQYLKDLILANHNLLLFLENAASQSGTKFDLVNHLKQFASVEIMRQYGLLLEDFKENGEFVNNCIFTMMHHMGGDLKNLPTLFQPSIIKSFSLIWETDYEICDDWSDLIEYVIHKFINSSRNSECKELRKIHLNALEEENNDWSKEEKDTLLGYYNQSQNTQDMIGNITKKYEENGMRQKTQNAIIHELFQQNIISEDQYNDFLTSEKPKDTNADKNDSQNNKFDYQLVINNNDLMIDEALEALKEYLVKENKGDSLNWLQKILLESCFAKIILSNRKDSKFSDQIVEPSVFYFASLNLPIPVVPWTVEQSSILNYQPFLLLLHKLGLYLPVDTGKIFVRIPNFWNADYLYTIALQLGPINIEKLKFDVNHLNGAQKCEKLLKKIENNNTSDENRNLNQNTPKIAQFSALTISIPSECDESYEHPSPSDTTSIASDLTRMCVSDEDDRVIILVGSNRK